MIAYFFVSAVNMAHAGAPVGMQQHGETKALLSRAIGSYSRDRQHTICYPEGCAAPGVVQCQCDTREPLSKLKRTSPPEKINVTSKSPVGDISVVTLIRTDTTLDHSQKAEKV